jgi:hypothetical protein
VWHSLDFQKEGKLAQGYSWSLKSALRAAFEEGGFCSDLVLVYEGRRFNVHRAIVAVRSRKLAKMIQKQKEPKKQADSDSDIRYEIHLSSSALDEGGDVRD